jgi:hypothetical protein
MTRVPVGAAQIVYHFHEIKSGWQITAADRPDNGLKTEKEKTIETTEISLCSHCIVACLDNITGLQEKTTTGA